MKLFPHVMRPAVFVLFCAATVSACGNEADMDPGARLLKLLAQTATARVTGGKSAPDATPSDLDLRAALQEGGKPIIKLRNDNTGATAYLAPVAVNQGITTWSSNDRLTLSSRDGVLLATRGFGADLMAANVPTAARIARGGGTHDRLHVYLDGGDQTQKFTFTCTVATVGPEAITVMGLSYNTRHVTETCSGKSGTATNHYWFQGAQIRQSTQFLAPGVPGVTLQAVID